MRGIAWVAVAGAAIALTGCRREGPWEHDVTIICIAELYDLNGVLTRSLEDTVTFTISPRDSVGLDPRPCRSGYGGGRISLNAKSDTVSGTSVD